MELVEKKSMLGTYKGKLEKAIKRQIFVKKETRHFLNIWKQRKQLEIRLITLFIQIMTNG